MESPANHRIGLEIGIQIAVAGKTLGAGLVDVKSYYVESEVDVAEPIGVALRYVPLDKLSIVPDCGFSQTARWASRAKLRPWLME
jgi:5-methyltetrahydropteroyltriglutamate--homocysteine methyltransferase